MLGIFLIVSYNIAAMNMYDVTILLKPTLSEEGRIGWTEKLEKTVKALEGKTGKVTEMGKKQMAYKIQNFSEADYLNLSLELGTAQVLQLERKLAVDKEVLRHLIVKAE